LLVVEYETNNPILRETSKAVPETEFKLVEEQARHDGQVRLFVWASEGPHREIVEAIDDDPTAAELERLVDHKNRQLYRLVLTEEGMQWTTYHRWVELDGSLIRSRLQDGTWTTKMRLPSRSALQEYQSRYNDEGFDFQLVSVWVEEPRPEGPNVPDLTEPQRETFVRALELGYYEIPREVSTSKLAEDFEISDQAIIERLRRATAALGEQVLMQGSDSD
jgi:predicted DNA binding protein